jgi:HJR/Mrr/RecB family endonuclease
MERHSKESNGEVVKILGDAGEYETEIHAILENGLYTILKKKFF